VSLFVLALRKERATSKCHDETLNRSKYMHYIDILHFEFDVTDAFPGGFVSEFIYAILTYTTVQVGGDNLRTNRFSWNSYYAKLFVESLKQSKFSKFIFYRIV